jgi:hypothetical protein
VVIAAIAGGGVAAVLVSRAQERERQLQLAEAEAKWSQRVISASRRASSASSWVGRD